MRRFARVGLVTSAVLLACRPETIPPPQSPPTAPEPANEPAQPLPQAQEILSRGRTAMGTEHDLGALEGFYAAFRMTVLERDLGANTRVWWSDGMFVSETDMPGVGKTRIWTEGGELWVEEPGGQPRIAVGTEAHQHRWTTDVLLLAHWTRYFETATTQQRRTVDGQVLVDIELTTNDDVLTLSLEEATGVMVAQSFAQATPAGPVPTVQRIREYRTYNGIRIPSAWTIQLDSLVAEVEMTQFEQNPAIPWSTLLPSTTQRSSTESLDRDDESSED